MTKEERDLLATLASAVALLLQEAMLPPAARPRTPPEMLPSGTAILQRIRDLQKATGLDYEVPMVKAAP